MWVELGVEEGAQGKSGEGEMRVGEAGSGSRGGGLAWWPVVALQQAGEGMTRSPLSRLQALSFSRGPQGQLLYGAGLRLGYRLSPFI